jgi:hypothetical protein
MAGVVLLGAAVTLTLISRHKDSREEKKKHETKMSHKLIPPNPDEVMVIRDVTANVVTFSVPFLRFGRFPIGGRGTLGEHPSLSVSLRLSPVSHTHTPSHRLLTLSSFM